LVVIVHVLVAVRRSGPSRGFALQQKGRQVALTLKNPSHPGTIVREDVIEPLGLTLTDAAKALGVARTTLSSLLNESAALIWEMAIRIEKAFCPKADHFMRIQFAYDEAHARARQKKIRVKRMARVRKVA
jgi:addiction module HigA family antidote